MQNPNSKASLNLALLKDCFTPRSIDHVTYLRRSALHQWTRIVRSTSFATGEHVDTPPDCRQWTQFAAKNPYPQQTTEGHLSARLHCLYGPCIQAYNSASPASFWTDPVLAACARSRVYDARAYSHEGKRGPFFEGSGRVRVDWAQVEALLCILTVSYQRMVDRSRVPPQRINSVVYKSWQTPFAGLERRSCKQSGRNVTGEMGIAGEDPYGISGSWPTLSAQLPRTDILIKYCRASLAFPPTQTGPPLFLREYDQRGVMQLRVTKIQPRQGGSRGLPTVEMVGIWTFTCRETGVVSRHLLEGQVSPTEDGEIRWSIKLLVSLPVRRTPTHPEMHCTIQGVQIGGPNTARGVVGMMFPKYVFCNPQTSPRQRETDDPNSDSVAGDLTCPCPVPFAFWKH
ncbi:MAG: hypothetical protein L6R36_006606 [Xanthoria steineri]|nr:MAG: hypothetical protein L6R36_006606 [Xanthoria steineri]